MNEAAEKMTDRDGHAAMSCAASDYNRSLRKEIIRRRDSIPAGTRLAKDRAIEERLLALPQFTQAETIMLYASFRSEVSTRNLIVHSLSKGARTVLPKVNERDDILDVYAIKYIGELRPGCCWGIPEPPASEERKTDLKDIDIVITPGVAFDEACNRLGYGKGCYDKLLGTRKDIPAAPGLSKKPLFIGLAYEEQVVPFIPCSQYDIKMDFIITDKRIINCHGS